jgi:hypothetical protein
MECLSVGVIIPWGAIADEEAGIWLLHTGADTGWAAISGCVYATVVASGPTAVCPYSDSVASVPSATLLVFFPMLRKNPKRQVDSINPISWLGATREYS